MEGKKLDYFKEKLLQKQLSLTDMVQRTESYGREKDSPFAIAKVHRSFISRH
jgi:hypothetical protein